MVAVRSSGIVDTVECRPAAWPPCLLYPVGYNRGMAKRIDPDEYVRIGTAAAIAGVTRAYINRLIASGRFPAIAIDGQNFVRRADAEKFANPPKN
jgi:hypothetical protein